MDKLKIKMKLHQISKSNVDYFQHKNNIKNIKNKIHKHSIKMNKTVDDIDIDGIILNDDQLSNDHTNIEYPAISSYFSSQYYDSMYPDNQINDNNNNENNHNHHHHHPPNHQQSIPHHNTPNYGNITITTMPSQITSNQHRYSEDTLQTLKRDDSESFFKKNNKKMYPLDDSIIDDRNHRYNTRHSSSAHLNHLQLHQTSRSDDTNQLSSTYEDTQDSGDSQPFINANNNRDNTDDDKFNHLTVTDDDSLFLKSRRHTEGTTYNQTKNHLKTALYDKPIPRSNVVLPSSNLNKMKKQKELLPRNKIEKRKQMQQQRQNNNNNNNNNNDEYIQEQLILNDNSQFGSFTNKKRNSMPQTKTVYLSRKNNQRLTRTPNVKSMKKRKKNMSNSHHSAIKMKNIVKSNKIKENENSGSGSTEDEDLHLLEEYDLDPLNSRLPPQHPQIDRFQTHSESPPIPPIPRIDSNEPLAMQSIHLSSALNPSSPQRKIDEDDIDHSDDTKSTSNTKQTYDYDYDSDPVQPKPNSYHMGINSPLRTDPTLLDAHRQNLSLIELEAIIKEPASTQLQKFALTKENIDKLNDNYCATETSSNEESTSTDGLQSLEKIGKQLREISILTPDDDTQSRSRSNLIVTSNNSSILNRDSNLNAAVTMNGFLNGNHPMTPQLHNDATESDNVSQTQQTRNTQTLRTRITHLSASNTITQTPTITPEPTNTNNTDSTAGAIGHHTTDSFKRFQSMDTVNNNNEISTIPQLPDVSPPIKIDKQISITITPHNVTRMTTMESNDTEMENSRTHHNTAEYLSDDCDNSVNLSSTDFDSHNLDELPSKYLQPTPSPLRTPIDDVLNQDLKSIDISIDISSTKKQIKLPMIGNKPKLKQDLTPSITTLSNRRVLPVQVQKLKHKSKKKKKGKTKPKIKQSKRYSHDFSGHKSYRLTQLRRKSPRINHKKSRRQQPYINDDTETQTDDYDDNTLSMLMRGVLNDDDMLTNNDNHSHAVRDPPPPSTSIAYEEEKEMGFKSKIYGNPLSNPKSKLSLRYTNTNLTQRTNTQQTTTITIDDMQSYASTYHRNSVDLEKEMNYILENQKSLGPFSKTLSKNTKSNHSKKPNSFNNFISGRSRTRNSNAIRNGSRSKKSRTSKRSKSKSNDSHRTEDSTDTMPSLLIPITRPSDEEQEFLKLYHNPRSDGIYNKYKGNYSKSSIMPDNDGENSDSGDEEVVCDDDDEDAKQMEYHDPLVNKDINGYNDNLSASSFHPSLYSTRTENGKLSFAVRSSISQCFDLWLIMFHFISIISYISEIFICYTYYQIRGFRYELIGCALLFVIFLIYVRLLIKNTASYKAEKTVQRAKNPINIGMQKIKWSRDFAYNSPQYNVNHSAQKRFWVIRGLIVSSMVNCTHFTLQFVIYIFLLLTVDDWSVFGDFKKHQLYLLTTIIIFQCVCLSMTIINIIAYLWERNHYHSQSLSFRVLCLYLDIIRIIFVIYIIWNINRNIISSFYYLYFYVEYWLLFTLLILLRLIVICCNWKPMYQQFGCCRFCLYILYSLIEPLFRFIVIELFPHCCIYYMIHNIGTGKFDHYASFEKYFLFCSKNIVSIKQLICAPTISDRDPGNFYQNTVSRHYQLREIFEFIENGVYEYVQDDKFELSDESQQEILRRILTINYQILINDEISKSAQLHRHNKLLDLNNIILYEFHKMFQLALYPSKIHDMRQNYLKNSGSHHDDTPPREYDDIFQNRSISSKSSIFMEWFVQNELIANLHFEWNNNFIVTHYLYTTFYCKYIVTLFYIFTRITNICWIYFIIMNCIIYLLNDEKNTKNMSLEYKLLLLYICGIIILLQMFAHIMLLLFGSKSYKFEKAVWFLLPSLNAKYIHRLLNPIKIFLNNPNDDQNDDYSSNITTTTNIKTAVDIYESFCYKHIVSNHLYDNLGYDIGAVVVSFLGDDIDIHEFRTITTTTTTTNIDYHD